MKLKFWPGIIFVLFAANFTIVGVTVVAAARSASPVEPDYYARALRWDQPEAREARNMALGWSAAVRLAPARDAGKPDRLRLTVTLTDSSGRPLRAATRVSALLDTPPAGDEAPPPPREIELSHVEGGEYAATIQVTTAEAAGSPMRRVRLAVEAGFDLFTCERVVTTEVAPRQTP
jgi:hypothetical protein